MSIKTCKGCSKDRPVKDFDKHPSTKDRLQSSCKECYKRAKRERSAVLRGWASAYKLEQGCKNCSYDEHPAALHFHHLKDKDRNVALLISGAASLKRVMAEIAKCDVLCANCHAILTHSKD